MLGLCGPSNLLFEYSFYPLRSDVLFSNYFEDLFVDTIILHDEIKIIISRVALYIIYRASVSS